MYVSDILWATRNDYLDDVVLPYLWADVELLRHLNKAYDELCRETGIIRDASTVAITEIPILANKHTYAIDSRISEIRTPVHNITYDPTNDVYSESLIDVQDLSWIDTNIPYWRTEDGTAVCVLPDFSSGYLRIIRYPGTDTGYFSGAFTFVGGATKSITQTGALFSTYLVVGDRVVISGTTSNGTTASPSTFTVATVAADSFTVSETVVNESAAAGIIQKVISTLSMSVNRVGVQVFTIGATTTQSPEFKSEYHPYLIDGVLRDAYLKQDSQCLDKEKAAEHRNLFEANKQRVRIAVMGLRESHQRIVPDYGNL